MSRVTDGDTRHYTTEELRFQIVCLPFFGQFPKVFSKWNPEPKKKIIPLPGGELNPGVPRDRRGYSPLYYRGTTCLDFFVDRLSPNVVLNKSWSKKDHSSPRRGIEFRSPAWQAGMLTTIIPRNCVTVYSLRTHFSASFQRCFQIKCWTKKSVFLSSACNWTPVSRVTGGDTHHYTTEELHVSISLWTVFHQMRFWIKSWSKKVHSSPRGIEFSWQTGILAIILLRNYGIPDFTKFPEVFPNQMLNQKKCSSPRRGIQTGLSRDGRGYWSLYYRGITCLEFFDRLSPNAVLYYLSRNSRVTRRGCPPPYYRGTPFHIVCVPFFSNSQRCFQIKSWTKTVYSSPRRAIEPRPLAS